MKCVQAAVIAISLAFGGTAANAATLTLDNATYQALSDNDVGVFFAQHNASGSFADAFKFSLATGIADVVSFGFVPQGSFSNLSLKLFNSTTASYVNPASGVPLTTSTTFAGLQTGNNYQFEISGLATSSVSSYVGTATVSAVPLPAALPLFGAALAILGLAIRRKASQGV